ncbi:small subunit ribosomal protein S6 [Mycoplasmoides fastidiosum]|uniref:Small ribosomal subunit protein bS6 n=1 Tax=Mycoplasmoides fastidiosum TaxID=92758 RepID=A0ABU0M038_9BACT|nr:30S ribosomal protein S6 [Mycoplasmoides fastidiosum]MDQ0514213.1 small subunit ribosomal protein S6 [Mycoplasmoides fastidiosum]UUD37378.1 30S ribosomal protein S6 [Mycoplasmoides fastidiosum]
MNKYEIMLVVDGELSHEDSDKAISNLKSLFTEKNTTNFKQSVTWSDILAYPINKKTSGHRYLLNFESDDLKAIEEFTRLVTINKHVLRHLLINEERNYAYKSLHNAKKIKSAEFRQRKFQEYLLNKQREAAAQEAKEVQNANVVEAKKREVRDYKGLDTQSTTTKTLEREAKLEKTETSNEE